MKNKKILKELQLIRCELETIKMRLPPPKTLEWKRYTPVEKMFTLQEDKQAWANLLEKYLEKQYSGGAE